MRRVLYLLTLCLVLAVELAARPAAAAGPETSTGTDSAVVKDQMLYELGEVQKMMLALAEALPADSYNWRPKDTMRSAGEMLLHTARGNFSIPESWGVEPPEELILCGNDLDQGNLDKTKVIDLLRKSFEHARKAIESTPEGNLFKTLRVNNSQIVPFESMLFLLGRDREHLGRMIDYAMLKGIVPPWMGAAFGSS
jgi:hypothetical protein